MPNPKIVAGAGLGAGGSASLTGVDQCGILSVTTGATPPVGAGQSIFDFHFGGLSTNISDMALYPLDATTEALDYVLSGVAPTSIGIFLTLPGGVTLAASTTYTWAYKSWPRIGAAA